VGAKVFGVLGNRDYRLIFLSQLCMLTATGLAAIGFYLAAFAVSGWNSGAVVGISIAARTVVSHFGGALALSAVRRLPFRLSFILSGAALVIPATLTLVVASAWQIVVALFLLEVASTAFGAAFRGAALSTLRSDADRKHSANLVSLATNLEPAVTPLVALLLLGIAGAEALMIGSSAAVLASMILVLFAGLPNSMSYPPSKGSVVGLRAWPGLIRGRSFRGMIALNIVFAAAASMVLVNTPVFAMAAFGRSGEAVAIALAVFGFGSIAGIVLAPQMAARIPGTAVALFGAALVSSGLFIGSIVDAFGGLLVLWFALGVGCSLAQVPIGQFIELSNGVEDRALLRKARITMLGLFWIVLGPITGLLGSGTNLSFTFAVLGMLACMATFAAAGALRLPKVQ